LAEELEFTEEDIRDIINLLVDGLNDNIDEVMDRFGEKIRQNSLALILTDMQTVYGFLIDHGRFRVIEGEDAKNVEATAKVFMTKDFFVEYINADDWVTKAIEGFNTYKVILEAMDGKPYVHGKNILEILKFAQELTEKVEE